MHRGVSLGSPEVQLTRQLSGMKDPRRVVAGPFDHARFPRVAGANQPVGASMAVATVFRSNEKLDDLSMTANTTGVLDHGLGRLPELKAF